MEQRAEQTEPAFGGLRLFAMKAPSPDAAGDGGPGSFKFKMCKFKMCKFNM